jgi:DNA-binding FadR family transcriptional regulator
MLASLDRPPSLVEAVCQRIITIARENETSGRLPTERDLSSQLGVSRSVVREAAKRLELQGLLEIRQGSGMTVVDKLHKPLSSAVTCSCRMKAAPHPTHRSPPRPRT